MTRRLWFTSLLLPFFCGWVALGFAAADSSLPSAKEIVERYDNALGGRDAIMRHTSSTARGSTDVPGPEGKTVTLALVYYAAAPYKRLEKVTLPNNGGDVLNGFDGETAWSVDPRSGNAQVYTGDERESMKRDADFYYTVNELSWFKSMKTVGIEDFEGRPCYHLHGINNWNKSSDHFYDKETGLLAGYEFDSDLGLTRLIFTDYKKVDGVLVSMKQTAKTKSASGAWEVQQVLNFDSVTFNDVDPAVFAPPKSVRDLPAKESSPATH
jgi:hypothetical protein